MQQALQNELETNPLAKMAEKGTEKYQKPLHGKGSYLELCGQAWDVGQF